MRQSRICRMAPRVFGGDEKLTTALPDRLEHATVITTKGKSFRMRSAHRRRRLRPTLQPLLRPSPRQPPAPSGERTVQGSWHLARLFGRPRCRWAARDWAHVADDLVGYDDRPQLQLDRLYRQESGSAAIPGEPDRPLGLQGRSEPDAQRDLWRLPVGHGHTIGCPG